MRLLIASAIAGVAFQAAQGQEPQVFRSESDLVVLHVNVFDRRSDAVPGLTQRAFHVTEEGKPQTLSFFSSEDVPVAVGLLIDHSSSMLTRQRMVAAATTAFAASSHPADELFTLLFNEHVRSGLPPSVPFTRSVMLLEASLRQFPPGGLTALHDAVVAGLEQLEEASHQKRVLIVLSDGDDNASRHSEADMLERAARSTALVYTVSTDRLDAGRGNHRLLRRLSEASGGATYAPDKEAAVVDAFAEIAVNIRRGYSLGYVPTNTAHDGRYRRVEVAVRAPGFKNLKVRARDGYLAPRHTDDR